MAVDLPKVHERALEHTGRYVEGVKADQWDGATPDDEWNVRRLVNHVVSGNFWVGPLIGGKTIDEVGDRYDGDLLGDDPAAAYATVVAAYSPRIRPGTPVSFPVPWDELDRVTPADFTVHTAAQLVAERDRWQEQLPEPQRLPADLVEACFEVVEPQKDLLVGSGMFGGDVQVPAGADRQTELLAVLGREA